MRDILRKRVLVTGGAGFLGSHLCERLLADGHEVLCVDNFFTGTQRQHRALCIGNPHFELMRHDVTFPLYVEVDEIYNLACPASPIHYQHDPVQTTKTSVHGAINMLGLAKRVKAKILQASTSEVYGDPHDAPAARGVLGQRQPDRPALLLRRGQALRRDAVLRLPPPARPAHQGGAHLQHLRAAHAPQRRPRGVATSSSRRCKGEPITLYGDGSQTRSFCYVDDLVDGLVRLMDTPDEFTGPVNLGNPTEFTIRELAERVVALTGSRSTIEYKPLPADDPRQRQPDISLAEATLGWRPTVALDDGLKLTIAYFDKLLAGRKR